MAEEANSWIRRAKFCHTVCHRLDSSSLVSFPVDLQSDTIQERLLVLKLSNPKSDHIDPLIQQNLITNKQRSVSPSPQIVLSDTFKEARSDRRRFSTPHPQRKESDKRRMEKKQSGSPAPLNSGSLKVSDKSKGRKESAWCKDFHHAGGRVNSVEAVDEHIVDLSQLFLGLSFAHGAHSRLYHGIYKEEAVAVKIIRVPDDAEDRDLAVRLEKQFNREVTLLSRLCHRNIVKFVAACRRPPVYCVVTEYLSGGSLRAYLHKLDHKSLPLQKVIAIALELAHGMEYIHSQGVIHRDLKPGKHDPGTYRWMAPEMIKRKRYGRKVDVYSFGLILWEMVTGTIPYEDMNPMQAAFAVLNKNLRPVVPGDCPPLMRALIEKCWSLHADKRPEFWQIVKVLEQLELSSSSFNQDRTLNSVPSLSCQDHKKGVLHRHQIQKLGPVHPHAT
ncbi:Serine/threonine-protein kinase HT1 [Hibiscus syriacus]|uniref:Serine/threonine-protein kinase HT1 n=1 Tax=Hibiscus syriacus TaxID=106335 RepID=A0A6A2XDM6_HIBSY|nr:Serine/threonine-protein kinase HT1 [Hibiscus syriacus]